MTNDSRELFSHENLSSNDEYDLDAIPLHIVRTESFQGMPGHEDLVDNFRGLASYDRTGETFVDYAGTSDYSLDYASEVSIPRPQLSKQSNNVDMVKDKGVFQFDKVFPEKAKVVSSPPGIPEPKPFLLMRTNWTVTGMTISCIESKINRCLKNMPDASVNAVPGKCKVSFDFRLVLSSVFIRFWCFLKIVLSQCIIDFVCRCMFPRIMRYGVCFFYSLTHGTYFLSRSNYIPTFSHALQWDLWVMQCQGTGSCKMQVAIYSTDDKGVHIVECNRLSGDHGPFNEAYRGLKAAFAVVVEQPSLKRQSTIRDSFASNMGPIPCHECLSDEDAKKALQPILSFALSEFVEDQIEASRMLCEFSNDETLQQILCDAKTLRVILHLTQELSPVSARQNAFMTLANLTTQHGPCQEAIIEAGVLPVLLELVCNGSYETAELRREGARALANLSCRLAPHIWNKIGEESLMAWFTTIDALADERVKLHAMAARDSLRLVCV